METTGSREGELTSDHPKVSIYFPILDSMVSEIDHRFAEKNLEHMKLAVLILVFLSQTILLSGLDTDYLSVEYF